MEDYMFVDKIYYKEMQDKISNLEATLKVIEDDVLNIYDQTSKEVSLFSALSDNTRNILTLCSNILFKIRQLKGCD